MLYDRRVVVCYLGDVNLNGWLVEQGHALAFRCYSTRYVKQKDSDREAKRGIGAGRVLSPGRHHLDEDKTVDELKEVLSDIRGLRAMIELLKAVYYNPPIKVFIFGGNGDNYTKELRRFVANVRACLPKPDLKGDSRVVLAGGSPSFPTVEVLEDWATSLSEKRAFANAVKELDEVCLDLLRDINTETKASDYSRPIDDVDF